MRSKIWLAAVPALMLGLAACGEEVAQNNESSNPVAENPTNVAPGTSGSMSGASPSAPPAATNPNAAPTAPNPSTQSGQ